MTDLPAAADSRLLALASPHERSWPILLTEVLAGGALALLAAIGLVVAVLLAALGFSGGLDASPAWIRSALTATYPPSPGGRPLASYVLELSLGLSLFVFALVFVGFAAFVSRRRFSTFVTAAPAFRWKLVGAGLLIYAPIVGLGVAAWAVNSPGELAPPLLWPDTAPVERIVYLAACFVTLGAAAWAEEVVFRGWLLQRASQFVRRAPLIIVLSALLFSAAHFDPRPDAFVGRFIMGVVWAWIVLRTNGVEFTTGAHLANNLVICLFVEPLTLQSPASTGFDTAAVAWELLSGAMLVCAVLWMERGSRSAELLRVAPKP